MDMWMPETYHLHAGTVQREKEDQEHPGTFLGHHSKTEREKSELRTAPIWEYSSKKYDY